MISTKPMIQFDYKWNPWRLSPARMNRIVPKVKTFSQPWKWNAKSIELTTRPTVIVNGWGDFFEEWDGTMVSPDRITLYGDRIAWTTGSQCDSNGHPFPKLRLDDVRAAVWRIMLYCGSLDFYLPTRDVSKVRPTLERIHEIEKQTGLHDNCLMAWIDGTNPPSNIFITVLEF